VAKRLDRQRNPSDLESSISLLRRAQSGEPEARDAFYHRYFGRLSRWASGRLSPGARRLQDTSDIVQDVLIQFFTRIQDLQLRHDGALVAYLRTAIRNRIRDAARRVACRPEGLATTLPAESAMESRLPSPLEECAGSDSVVRYEAALEQLEDDERTAVFLKVETDYSNAGIAAALMSPSVDAARMFTGRAIAKLARVMKEP
jgi:RNA polymerase sigma factor (sigma-70 family)